MISRGGHVTTLDLCCGAPGPKFQFCDHHYCEQKHHESGSLRNREVSEPLGTKHDMINSFIHSGDLYSVSSRDYYCSKALPAQSRTKG